MQRNWKHTCGWSGDHVGRKSEGTIRNSCGEHAAGRTDNATFTARVNSALNAYRRAESAEDHHISGCRHGHAGFPMAKCAEIMLAEAKDHIERGSSVEKIYFVLVDDQALKTFEKVWQKMQAEVKNAKKANQQ
jgi:O-acetyl-ADP-ribose deacetylase (regulator of RNase III)